MELKIENGDYVRGPGGVLETVSGTDALVQRAAMRLAARRGEFVYDAALGSHLDTLKPDSPDAERRAFAMAQDALRPMPEISVLSAHVTTAGCTVTLLIGDVQKEVEVKR